MFFIMMTKALDDCRNHSMKASTKNWIIFKRGLFPSLIQLVSNLIIRINLPKLLALLNLRNGAKMQDFYCTIYLLDNAIMYTCLVPNVIMPHPKKKQNAILNNKVQVIILYRRIQIKFSRNYAPNF